MSDESRRYAQEGLKQKEIKQLGEGEIFAAGLAKGRMILDTLQTMENAQNDPMIQRSVGTHFNVGISTFTATDSMEPTSLENQLLEAYRYNHENGLALQDNIHGGSADTLVYTSPLVLLAGDSVILQGMFVIKMATKEIVNSIEMDYGLLKN